MTPSKRLPGAIEIDVAGEKYHAYLGAVRTPVKGVELAAGGDGWIEVVPNGVHVYSGGVELVPRATLLVGDALSTARGGEPLLRVISA